MTISDLTDRLIQLQTKYSCGTKGSWDPEVCVRDMELGTLRKITGARLTDNDPHGDEGELVVILGVS